MPQPRPRMPDQRTIPTRTYSSVAVPNPGALLVIATCMSLLVHAAVLMGLHNLPIGHIDPSLLRDSEKTYRVVRSEQDRIVIPDTVSAGDGTQQTDPADLSRALLDQTLTPQPPSFEPPITGLDDSTFDSTDAPDLTQTPGESLVPEDVMTQLAGTTTPDLPYRSGTQATRLEGGGDGGLGAAADEARSLLAGTGLYGGMLPMDPVRAADPLPETHRPDATITQSPALGVPLDLGNVAIDQTRKLPVPIGLDNDFEYRVTVYQPQAGADLPRGLMQHGYFRVDITGKRSLQRLRTMPKDTVFLIDISGSIPQRWVDQVVAGVSDALSTLGPDDRFNIVFFSNQPRFFSEEKIVPATEQSIREARQFLRTARSRSATDINQALSRLLMRDLEVDRVYNLVFISDGLPTEGVTGTRELINLITRDNNLIAGIYCVGVGTRQNHELLDFLSYRNKGFSVYARRPEDASQLIRQLGSRLRFPIIKDVQLNIVGKGRDKTFPLHLPNIHQGETFSVYGQFDQLGSFTMRLRGRNGEQIYDFTFTRDLAQVPRGTEQIARDWAFVKLHHLYSELLRRGDETDRAIRRQIDHIRTEYGLKTLY